MSLGVSWYSPSILNSELSKLSRVVIDSSECEWVEKAREILCLCLSLSSRMDGSRIQHTHTHFSLFSF
jgi:hypothetical protein